MILLVGDPVKVLYTRVLEPQPLFSTAVMTSGCWGHEVPSSACVRRDGSVRMTKAESSSLVTVSSKAVQVAWRTPRRWGRGGNTRTDGSVLGVGDMGYRTIDRPRDPRRTYVDRQTCILKR